MANSPRPRTSQKKEEKKGEKKKDLQDSSGSPYKHQPRILLSFPLSPCRTPLGMEFRFLGLWQGSRQPSGVWG